MPDEVFGDDFDDEDDFEQRRSSGGLSGKRLLLVVLLALAIVIGAAVAVIFFTDFGKELTGGMGGDSAPAAFEKVEPGQRAANRDQTARGANQEGLFSPQFVPVPPLLVNLQSADTRRRNNFLKLTIWIEVADGQQNRVESAMPKIVDTLQVYLRSLRVEELQGSAGIDRLRRDILIRAQKAAESFGAPVNDVLFKEMLVQ